MLAALHSSIDHPTGTPIKVWDPDEPSLREIDCIERKRLILDDTASWRELSNEDRALLDHFAPGAAPDEPA